MESLINGVPMMSTEEESHHDYQSGSDTEIEHTIKSASRIVSDGPHYQPALKRSCFKMT